MSKLFAFVVCEHVAPETLLFATLLGHKVQSPKQHGPSKLSWSIIIPCFYGAEGFFFVKVSYLIALTFSAGAAEDRNCTKFGTYSELLNLKCQV